MSMEKMLPAIRFKRFSGEWSYASLSKIADKFDNLRIPVTAKDRISGSTPYFGANGIQGYVEGYTHEGEYVLLAEDGANDLKNYPIHYVNGKVWVNNHAHVLKAKERYSNLFLKYALVSIDFEPFLVGGGRAKLNASVMMDLDVTFTENIEEQTAIGTYFQKLDALINQHQQKHDKLSNLKKAMLVKMFPKPGETTPEIRFKGFSGEWTDATLSDLIDVRSGKDYKHLGKGDIPVYGTGGYMLSVDSALSNDEDAIGIGRKGTIDKPYLLRAPFWTVDTLFYAVPKPKFKLDYLYCFFQKIDWKKHDESTGVPSLSKIAINNIPVQVTSEKEQTAIGNYFQKLDTLISQHQQQISKLNNIKQACLSKMFV